METIKFELTDSGRCIETKCPYMQGAEGWCNLIAGVGSGWCQNNCKYFHSIDESKLQVNCLYKDKYSGV